MSFVSHVECTVCGTRHDPKGLLTVCATCRQMVAVRYDLDRVKAAATKERFASGRRGCTGSAS